MTKRDQNKKQRASTGGIVARALSAIALILLGLSWPRLLAGKSAWVEQNYSEGSYQPIRRAISAVTRVVPFSLAELLFYGIVIGVGLLFLIRLIQLVLGRIKFSRVIATVFSILLAGGIVLNLFYATWGFNYFREPLAQRMELPVQTRSVDELEAYVKKIALQARELRKTLHEDENGVFSPLESK